MKGNTQSKVVHHREPTILRRHPGLENVLAPLSLHSRRIYAHNVHVTTRSEGVPFQRVRACGHVAVAFGGRLSISL